MKCSLENLTTVALKTGVQKESGGYTCITCGSHFAKGEVYPAGGRYLQAKAAACHHAENAHGSRLDALLESEARYVSVTEHQKKLLHLMAQGKSDAEIAAETGAAPATVRRQRFSFREKAKQAKMFLAIYELATQKPSKDALVPVHGALPNMDDRFVITEAENKKFLAQAFESLEPLRLRTFPAREKRKIAVLNRIATQFEAGRDYTEKQVNEILRGIEPQQYVVLRRYLIEYGYLARERDGSRYWVV